MPKLLKQFGAGSSSIEWGYDLPVLIGHLESLCHDEEDNISSPAEKLKVKRLELVENALELLNEALIIGKEDY